MVVNVLPSLYTDRNRLAQILSAKALSNRSQASSALYHAILALASYQRRDDMLEVDRFKRTALRDLYTHCDISVDDSVDHIAANMILCLLEVLKYTPPTASRPTNKYQMQQTYGDNSCWISYLHCDHPSNLTHHQRRYVRHSWLAIPLRSHGPLQFTPLAH
jgi:hypothetical protein